MPAVPINMGSAEVSAEVHFAQKLASNEKKIRDRAIKRLRKYLFARSSHGGLTENDHVKIWKGLHYCMWMQDKPLLQEELSQRISGLLQSFSSPEGALLFMKVFLETEAREWNGIDKLRLDKFMMMIRDMLHQTFVLLSNVSWSQPECRQFAQAVALKVMLPEQPQLPDGLKLHLADIYVDELLKVPLDKMNSRKMVLLLRPFVDFLVYTSKSQLAQKVMQGVIGKVLNTMSSVKRKAQSLSPVDSSKSQQDDDDEESGDEIDDEEIDENVDITEDSMEVDEETIAENMSNFVMDADLLLLLLFKLANDPKVKAKNRAMVYKLVKKYPEIYDNIVNLLNSSSGDHKTNSNLEGDTSGTLDDLSLFPGDGRDGDQKQQQKKKKRKNKNNKKGGDGEITGSGQTETPVGVELHKDSENKSQQANRKRGKVGVEVQEDLEKKSSKPLKRKRDSDEDGGDQLKAKSPKVSPKHRAQLSESSPSATDTKSKKTKKKKRKSSEKESKSNAVPSMSDSLQSDPSTVSSITKQDKVNADASPKDKNSNALGVSNKSPRRSAADLLATPVEMVIYPQQSQVKERSRRKSTAKKGPVSLQHVEENSRLASTVSGRQPLFTEPNSSLSSSPASSSSQSSVSLAISLFSAAAKRKKSAKKGGKSSPPPSSSGLSDEAGGHAKAKRDSTASIEKAADWVGECECDPTPKSGSDVSTLTGMVNEFKSVFSSIKQRYMGHLNPDSIGSKSSDNTSSESSMDWSQGAVNSSTVAMTSLAPISDGEDDTLSKEDVSRTDPGPDREKAKNHMNGDMQSMTPSGKKKVVFDLRRNRANNFQDYIKSLTRQPESPYQPEKSPSNSILKPNLSPVISGKKKSSQKGSRKKMSARDSSRSPAASPGRPKSARSRSSLEIS